MTNSNTNSPAYVTTPRGARIPKIGTLAYHPSIGFCDVIGRVGERVRIRVTDFSEALPVTLSRPLTGDSSVTPEQAEVAEEFGITSMLRNAAYTETISRRDWMKRLAATSDNTALAECATLDARAQDDTDALYGASPLVRQLQESVMSRCRAQDEMLVALDGAEDVGWEFDEYLVSTPSRKTLRGKAPAPRPYQKPASRVGTLEDPTKPDWLVAEMNECFGDTWTPANPERDAAFNAYVDAHNPRS